MMWLRQLLNVNELRSCFKYFRSWGNSKSQIIHIHTYVCMYVCMSWIWLTYVKEMLVKTMQKSCENLWILSINFVKSMSHEWRSWLHGIFHEVDLKCMHTDKNSVKSTFSLKSCCKLISRNIFQVRVECLTTSRADFTKEKFI